MANWNRWAVAGGLAGALAVFGPAWAQSGPGAATEPGSPGTGTSNTTDQSAGAPRDSGKSMSDRNTGSSSTGTNDQSTAGSATGSTGASDQTATGATAGSSDTAATGSKSGSSGKVDKKLQDDLQKLHADNQAEVQMGQMGEQQASSPEVKQFAQKLQQDHQKLDDKVTQTAQSAGISLEGKAAQSETKDAEKDMQKLHGKTGQDFDKAFVKQMVKDHEKDIKAMDKAAKQARKDKQDELASLFEQASTGMKGHLQEAKQLEKTLGKSGKSARGTSGSSTGSGSTGGSSSMGGSSSTGDTGSTGSSGTGAGSSYGGSAGSPGSSSGSTGSDTTGNSGSTSKPSGSGQ